MRPEVDAMIEDVEFMLDSGCADKEIVAERLRKTGQTTSYATLERALYRAGRNDLIKRFDHAQRTMVVNNNRTER